MPAFVIIAAAATGTLLLGRSQCVASRAVGGALLMTVALAAAAPACADQTILSADSAQIDCAASARDLTRISLIDDAFASVQKIATGNPLDDFSVVNEPLRGDIYLSVPDGYARGSLSFFATTRRGHVYKFLCKVSGDDATQIFVSNPAIAREEDTAVGGTAHPDRQDRAIALVRAMYGGAIVDGYVMRQRGLKPATVGNLKVQLIAEYRGPDLVGKVLRIENAGRSPVQLSEQMVAPGDVVAVAIAEPALAPGRVTTAYFVSKGDR